MRFVIPLFSFLTNIQLMCVELERALLVFLDHRKRSNQSQPGSPTVYYFTTWRPILVFLIGRDFLLVIVMFHPIQPLQASHIYLYCPL